MLGLLVLTFTVASPQLQPDSAFDFAVAAEIEQFIDSALLGHYDVETITIDDVVDRGDDLGAPLREYQVRRVTASFRAIRNAHWSASVNRDVPVHLRDTAQLFLYFRPVGYTFGGTLDVDMARTVDGWKILSRHHRSLQPFPLAGYLHCGGEPRPDDSNLTIIRIRACLTTSEPPGSSWLRDRQ